MVPSFTDRHVAAVEPPCAIGGEREASLVARQTEQHAGQDPGAHR
jgi:hypothetical protein